MKTLLLALVLVSQTALAGMNYQRELRRTQIQIDELEFQKAHLEEVYADSARFAKVHTAAKWVGAGIPAFMASVAGGGFAGFIFFGFASGAVSKIDNNAYTELQKLLAQDFFTEDQKKLVRVYSAELGSRDEKQALEAQLKLETLINAQVNAKIAAELAKDEYDFAKASYFSRPQAVANYLAFKISVVEYNLAFQTKKLEQLQELQRL